MIIEVIRVDLDWFSCFVGRIERFYVFFIPFLTHLWIKTSLLHLVDFFVGDARFEATLNAATTAPVGLEKLLFHVLSSAFAEEAVVVLIAPVTSQFLHVHQRATKRRRNGCRNCENERDDATNDPLVDSFFKHLIYVKATTAVVASAPAILAKVSVPTW